MTDVLAPKTLEELWSFLENEPEGKVYAGGTDLLVWRRARGGHHGPLICLERIDELKGVREEPGGLWIGAATTHRRLLDDPRIRDGFPVLAQALAVLGSPPVRNMGTIGGNICTASPAGDTLPPLYVLGAEVLLLFRGGERAVPVASFIKGPGLTALERGEIVSGVRIRYPAGFNRHHFEKVGQRKALAIAVASLAALMAVSASGEIEAVRLAWGSVGPTVVTSPEVEAALTGRPLCLATLREAAALAREVCRPIDDLRATAAYRRQVAGNLLLRLGI
ncbi:MAG TPA: xanthine dehydrogenase family protein subunit M [Syntrophales bacterium]|nr:xanthine dehydrogenase family protein subunit M [Syntrophales bacterium]HOO01024.1 xanthine dehydrogenase family protein subunit M [Syntrophales bacterium]HPQ05502.1 xanthine dehydrogenase family protein subunit M [Syntrophales bacterium]